MCFVPQRLVCPLDTSLCVYGRPAALSAAFVIRIARFVPEATEIEGRRSNNRAQCLKITAD